MSEEFPVVALCFRCVRSLSSRLHSLCSSLHKVVDG